MREMFQRSGEVGHDLLAVDWDATPLGPPETWPRSLESVVRLVLTSRFSMWMAWGPELTFFCNDAYRRDTLGGKYPWALGKPASVVWSEIWDDIGPRIDTVMSDGEATWDESLMLFLERSGYTEETFHTFSYSPIFDDEGAIAGMLCVVKEDTEEVVARRRMQTLRDLGARRAVQPHRGGDHRHRLPRARAARRSTCRSRWSTCTTTTAAPRGWSGSTGFTGDHPAAPPAIDVEADLPTRPGRPPRRCPARPRWWTTSRAGSPTCPPGRGTASPRQALVVPLRRRAAGAGRTASRSSG